MTAHALAWALSAPSSGDMPPATRLVLAALADSGGGDDGVLAFRADIARRMGLRPSTVEAALLDLESRGLVTRGDRLSLDHFPAERGAVEYRLNVDPRGA